MHFSIRCQRLHVLKLHRPAAWKRITLNLAVQRRRRVAWLARKAEGVGHFAHTGGGIPAKWFIGKTHRLAQSRKDPLVGPGFAASFDGRLHSADDVASIGALDFVLLEKGHR